MHQINCPFLKFRAHFKTAFTLRSTRFGPGLDPAAPPLASALVGTQRSSYGLKTKEIGEDLTAINPCTAVQNYYRDLMAGGERILAA